jgi:hypothetical protein
MLKKSVLLSLLIFQILTCCTSGRRAFENGDYERASYLAIDRLRRNPDHKKSRVTLEKAYSLFIKKTETDIRNTQNDVNPLKWDNVVGAYQRVHNLFDQIKACPAALEVVRNPVRYDADLQEARKRASEAHYELGLTELAIGTREKAKSAYYQFKQAQEYFPNLKSDYIARLNEAKQKATISVALFFLPTSANTNLQRYSLIDVITRNDLNQFVQELDKRDFLHATLIAEPSLTEDANDLVKLAYTQFNTDQPQFKETVEQRLDSVRIEKQINGQTFVSYEKVWAEVAIREKTLRATSSLEVIITDTDGGQILFNQSTPAEYIWSHKWAILRNGDKRALTQEQQRWLEVGEQMTPSYQMLFEELQKKTNPLLRQKIQQYYNQY